jgi:uncharacterized protein (TIGR04442 family)
VFKDIRVHGAITPEIDYYANLAGEKLLPAPFYEVSQEGGRNSVAFFLAGMYLRLSPEGVAFSGTGGVVSEYMFGSPMPLQDLGHKEVRNRLVMFGAFMGETGGLSFTAYISGQQSYENLFLDGNALGNYFFLIKTPWPYSARRTQEVLLKTLGRVLKRSDFPGAGADSDLGAEILKELAEPDATLLLLRLAHRPHQQFHQFVRDYYRRTREWGDSQKRFVDTLGEELDIQEYQRERIAIDILYKDAQNKQIVDEYKDVLLSIMLNGSDPSALARLNSLRNLAMRHNLPRSLFDTLDGLMPTAPSVQREEREYLHGAREIFEGLFLSSKPPTEVIGHAEIVRLLGYKQQAQQFRDNGFEQILLDTGRVLDERAAEGGDIEPFEVFSQVVTYFDRLDNAEAVVNQLAFMEHATVAEDRVRSLVGNKRELDAIEPGLFHRLVVEPALRNPYSLAFGRRKVEALYQGLEHIGKGECTHAEAAVRVNELAQGESAQRHLNEAIRGRLKQFYFNLSNAIHVRLLQREVEGELHKRDAEIVIPEGAFAAALEDVKAESEYLNDLYPKLLENPDAEAREAFILRTGLDRYRVEELEREYRIGHGLEETAPANPLGLDF